MEALRQEGLYVLYNTCYTPVINVDAIQINMDQIDNVGASGLMYPLQGRLQDCFLCIHILNSCGTKLSPRISQDVCKYF